MEIIPKGDRLRHGLVLIGELYLKSRVSIPRLKSWHARGFLPHAGITPGGLRLYDLDSSLERIARIKMFVEKGLTLGDISKQGLVQ